MPVKTSRLKKLVVRYVWAGPIVGFVLGIILGPGSFWHLIDLRLKNHEVNIGDIRLEKEIYERQQVLLQQSADDIITYVNLRDAYFESTNYEADSDYKVYSSKILVIGGTSPSEKQTKQIESSKNEFRKFNELRIRFLQQKTKLVSLITEYNQLEAEISVVEERQPVWFDTKTIGLVPPQRLSKSNSQKGETNVVMVSWTTPPDPATMEVVENLKQISTNYGRTWNSK